MGELNHNLEDQIPVWVGDQTLGDYCVVGREELPDFDAYIERHSHDADGIWNMWLLFVISSVCLCACGLYSIFIQEDPPEGEDAKKAEKEEGGEDEDEGSEEEEGD